MTKFKMLIVNNSKIRGGKRYNIYLTFLQKT